MTFSFNNDLTLAVVIDLDTPDFNDERDRVSAQGAWRFLSVGEAFTRPFPVVMVALIIRPEDTFKLRWVTSSYWKAGQTRVDLCFALMSDSPGSAWLVQTQHRESSIDEIARVLLVQTRGVYLSSRQPTDPPHANNLYCNE